MRLDEQTDDLCAIQDRLDSMEELISANAQANKMLQKFVTSPEPDVEKL